MLPTDPEDRYGLGYAIAAYVLIFAAVFGYLAWIHLAQRRLARRLQSMERRLESEAARARDDRPQA